MNMLPNIITSVRLVCSLILVVNCFLGRADGFVILFVLSGLSDMLDGIIARRFKWCTEFGATLDSISDLALYVATLIFLCTFAGTEVAKCALFLGLGFVVQAIHIAICVRRHGGFPAYHTLFSKVVAYICFAGILAFWITREHQILIALTFVWVASSIEGMVITYVLKQPMRDLTGIRHALRATD